MVLLWFTLVMSRCRALNKHRRPVSSLTQDFVFYDMLKASPNVVSDPEEADYFYLPIFPYWCANATIYSTESCGLLHDVYLHQYSRRNKLWYMHHKLNMMSAVLRTQAVGGCRHGPNSGTPTERRAVV